MNGKNVKKGKEKIQRLQKKGGKVFPKPLKKQKR